jgi:hypothetical protein
VDEELELRKDPLDELDEELPLREPLELDELPLRDPPLNELPPPGRASPSDGAKSAASRPSATTAPVN